MEQLNTLAFEPGKKYYVPNYFRARVMSPHEVAAGLNPRYSNLTELQNRWMFCGDVSASTFDLLRTASGEDVDFDLSIFESSAGGNYCIMTHQVQS